VSGYCAVVNRESTHLMLFLWSSVHALQHLETFVCIWGLGSGMLMTRDLMDWWLGIDYVFYYFLSLNARIIIKNTLHNHTYKHT